MTWRFAVVGTGQIAHLNVPALLQTRRAEVVTLCNRHGEKARAFARHYGLDVPVYEDMASMLAAQADELDALLICTPHGQHLEAFELGARYNKAILIEKPLAVTAEECRDMIRMRDEAGIRAAVCHTQRYLPLMRLALATLERERDALGPLKHVTDTRNIHYFHDQRPAWFFDAHAAGGGLLLTHGAHQIDRALFLGCPMPTRLYARLEASDIAGIDAGYQILATADSGGASMAVSCSGYPTPHTSATQLDFAHGSMRIVLYPNGEETPGVYLGGPEGFSKVSGELPAEDDTYLCQFHDLLNYLEEKPATAPTLEHATQVMRVLDAVRQSGATQKLVAV